MTINARSELDLEEDTILDKVSKASGQLQHVFLYPSLASFLSFLSWTVQKKQAMWGEPQNKTTLPQCRYHTVFVVFASRCQLWFSQGEGSSDARGQTRGKHHCPTASDLALSVCLSISAPTSHSPSNSTALRFSLNSNLPIFLLTSLSPTLTLTPRLFLHRDQCTRRLTHTKIST